MWPKWIYKYTSKLFFLSSDCICRRVLTLQYLLSAILQLHPHILLWVGMFQLAAPGSFLSCQPKANFPGNVMDIKKELRLSHNSRFPGGKHPCPQPCDLTSCYFPSHVSLDNIEWSVSNTTPVLPDNKAQVHLFDPGHHPHWIQPLVHSHSPLCPDGQVLKKYEKNKRVSLLSL